MCILSIYLPIYLSIYLPIYLSISVSLSLSLCLSLSLPVFISLYSSSSLAISSIYIYIYIYISYLAILSNPSNHLSSSCIHFICILMTHHTVYPVTGLKEKYRNAFHIGMVRLGLQNVAMHCTSGELQLQQLVATVNTCVKMLRGTSCSRSSGGTGAFHREDGWLLSWKIWKVDGWHGGKSKSPNDQAIYNDGTGAVR